MSNLVFTLKFQFLNDIKPFEKLFVHFSYWLKKLCINLRCLYIIGILVSVLSKLTLNNVSIDVTKALVLLGFDSWSSLEPGNI